MTDSPALAPDTIEDRKARQVAETTALIVFTKLRHEAERLLAQAVKLNLPPHVLAYAEACHALVAGGPLHRISGAIVADHDDFEAIRKDFEFIADRVTDPLVHAIIQHFAEHAPVPVEAKTCGHLLRDVLDDLVFPVIERAKEQAIEDAAVEFEGVD